MPAPKLAFAYVMAFWRPPDQGLLDAPIPKSRKRLSNIARPNETVSKHMIETRPFSLEKHTELAVDLSCACGLF